MKRYLKKRGWFPRTSAHLSLLILTLTGCASGPQFRPEAGPNTDQALIYIYRVHAKPLWMRTAVISIDGKQVGELPNGGYLAIQVVPGEHSITQSWSNWAGDYSALTRPQNMVMKATAGGTHFVEFSLTERREYPNVITTWRIGEVDPVKGAETIVGCKKQDHMK